MAVLQEISVPDFGEVEGVMVVDVMVSVGSVVAVDDPIVLLESDKASMEVPSPAAGIVRAILLNAGDPAERGTVILELELSADAPLPAPDPGAKADTLPAPDPGAKADTLPAPDPIAPGLHEAPSVKQMVTEPARETGYSGTHASPGTRRFARELGVGLSRVPGTGRKGRITKDDVQSYVKRTLALPGDAAATRFTLPSPPRVDHSKFGQVRTEPMSRTRHGSARNLHRSWLHIPHVTQHEEADITDLDAFRRANGDEASGRGFKLTPLAPLLKATASALRRFPRFRSSLDESGENLIIKDYIHIGVAVDTPDGLVVPVLRDVEGKGILEIAAELAEISARARDRALRFDDLQGAVFTVSSLGGIGGTAFTPVVNLPEVAILGVSRAYQKPVWRDDQFVPRLMLPLSLSYDHRVIDGAEAARFVVHLGELLGDLRRLLL